jgi:hypothetical protein
VQYKQQASPLLSMHNYTLVISGNDNNKELTLLSQRKRALTGRNMYCKWLCKFAGTSKKIKSRGDAIHLYHQKHNTARETVPLKEKMICYFCAEERGAADPP